MSQRIYDTSIKYATAFFLLMGIILHIVPYFFHRSLWVDEAMIASSICTRGFDNLVMTPLDYGQSAPIGYLYIVKLFTIIFGVNDVSLRIWSLITFFVALYIFWWLLKYVFELKRPAFFTAGFSLYGYYIGYSHELKPYMADNMFILLTIALFSAYMMRKMSFLKVSVIYAVIIWFSFSSVFFIGACMLLALIDLLSKKVSLKNGAVCILPAISLMIYYLFWLNSATANVGDMSYWEKLRFPILPTTFDDFYLIAKMIRHMLDPLSWKWGIVMALFAFATLGRMNGLKQIGQQTCQTILGGLVFLLVASSMGFYPIINRLVQFIAILILLLASVSLESIWCRLEEKNSNRRYGVMGLVMILFLLIPLRTGIGNLRGDGGALHHNGSEVAANVAYLHQHQQVDDMIYIYSGALPIFMYEYNYPYGASINYVGKKGGIIDNYILGSGLSKPHNRTAYGYESIPNEENIAVDIANTSTYSSVYLFTAHLNAEKDENWQYFLSELKQYGEIEVVSESHKTYLYHFTRKDTE